MNDLVFYLPAATPVMRRLRSGLLRHGCKISDTPCNEVTHLILEVPSLDSDGSLKNGGSLDILLRSLPEDVTVIGGNLDHSRLDGYRKLDLLKNEDYLWENAAITADCAVSIARQQMTCRWEDCPTLILGWGRIAIHLTRMLQLLGADITVAARKDAALAQARSLGIKAISINDLAVSDSRVIFNTIPAMVLPEELAAQCRPDCIQMDLASHPGIGGSGVIWARGLPGKNAPESAGDLMVKTILKSVRKEVRP